MIPIDKGRQPPQPGTGVNDNLSPLVKTIGAVSAIGASGFIPTRNGRLWDNYLTTVRNVETGFPSAILRTLRTSEFLSPLESYNKIDVGHDLLKSGKYSEFLKASFGEAESYSLKRTGSVFGAVKNEAGKTLGYGVQIESGTHKGTAIADYYARISGVDLGLEESLNDSLLRQEHKALKTPLSYKQWLKTLEPHQRRRRLILGAQLRNELSLMGYKTRLSEQAAKRVAKAEVTANLIRAKLASSVGRLNTLLSAPLELPLVGNLISKIPGYKNMMVKPGTAGQMLGRLAWKGTLVGAGFHGLEYLDYLRSEGSLMAPVLSTAGGAALGGLILTHPSKLFSKTGLLIGAGLGAIAGLAPRFDEGLFYGAASTYGDASIAHAQLSGATGLTSSLQEQERVTPGLVSKGTALGVGLSGGLLAGFASYGKFLKEAVYNRNPGEHLYQAFDRLRESGRDKQLLSGLWNSGIGKRLEKVPLLGRAKNIKSPMLLGFLGGVAAWQATSSALSILSGNPLAAIPGAALLGTTETPEHLQKIYSGEEEIAVRKGRFWELGRCLIKSNTYKLFDNSIKTSDQISVGDILIGRDFKKARVLNIFTRNHKGEIYKFSSAFDRDIITGVTAEHRIPILKKKYPYPEELIEVNASEIQVNDFVEIPMKNYSSKETKLITSSILQGPIFIYKDRVYAAQKNWHSGNLQKSGTHSIPLEIDLNNDLGFLFGIFLAEGSLGIKNETPHLIEMVHSVHEEWIVKRIQEITKQYFNIETTVRFKTTGKKTKEGCYITRICSSVLARLFRYLFYPEKYDSYLKDVPSVFKNGSVEFKEGLIKGYYSGDGHWDGTEVISSSRKWLLEKIQLIGFSIGRLSGIGPKEENGFLGKWRLRFVSDLSTNPALIIYNNKLYASIRSISVEDYDDIVYDFEVDHPDHLFQAGTFLVHNSSAYEGGRIDYFRQHALARLKNRSYQKGIYGDEAERWDYDPLLHPLDAVFGSDDWKYHYEQEHQYDRPAPMSSSYFQDVPFVGPLLSATIGNLLKPRKLIRSDEWNLGNEEYTHQFDSRRETEPSYELGGKTPGAPVRPDDTSQLLNELNYRRREMIGLPGFIEGSVNNAILGREEVLPNLRTLDQMGKETGSEYWLWKHMNLGGAAGTCLPAGEKTLTPNGLVNIEDLKIGDVVYDNNFKEQYITNTFIRECNSSEKIITLKLATGNVVVKTTDKHPVAILKRIKCRDNHKRPCTSGNPKQHCKVCGLRNNSFYWEWTQAIDVSVGDFVAMPLPKERQDNLTIDLSEYVTTESYSNKYIYNNNCSSDFVKAYELLEENQTLTRKDLKQIVKDQYGKEALRSHKNGNKPKRIPRFIDITEDFAYFLGWYIAEGCSKNQVSLTLNINEIDIATKLGEIYKSIFGYSYCIIKKEEEHSIRLKFQNPVLGRFLNQFGKGAKKKELSWLVNLPKNLLTKVIDGLINGDGWLNPKLEKGGFTSSSNKLVRDFWLALCSLGVFSNVVDNYIEIPNGYYPQGTKRKITTRSYLSFARNQYNNLIKVLSGETLPEEISNGRNFKTKDFVYIPVKEVKIESAEKTIVYDIEVANSHCFIGNYLLLHNSESIRRFIPHTRSYLDFYNPLKNDLPSWIPGDYFLDLKTGNPFNKIPEAELRLPGEGYASRFSELEGLDPERYPLAHKVKILGDIAYYSSAYRKNLSIAKSRIDELSPEHQSIVRETERQVREKKQRKEFTEYRFNGGDLINENVTVSQVLSPTRFLTEEYGNTIFESQGIGSITDKANAMRFAQETLEGRRISVAMPSNEDRRFSSVVAGPRIKAVPLIGDHSYGSLLAEQGYADDKPLENEFEQLGYSANERLAGTISEKLLHGLNSPLESLTPLSPASKFIRQRSAVEDYMMTQAIGCLLPTQYIKTKEGIKFIKDVQPGDKVYSEDGKWHSVICVTNKIMPHNKIVKITPSCSRPFPIQVTPDHKILIWSNVFNKPVFVQSEVITTEHELVYPVPFDDYIDNQEEFKKISISEIIENKNILHYPNNQIKIGSWRNGRLLGCNSSNLVNNNILLDENFYMFLGWYLAEGCSTKKNKLGIPSSVSFAFHTKEKEYYNFVVSFLKTAFNLTATIKIQENRCELVISSTVLAMFLKELCGPDAQNKKIKNLLFPTSIKNILALLKGYIRGDGHYNEKTRSISCVSISLNLLQTIKDLLASIGILSTLGRQKAKSYTYKGIKINQKTSYFLNVSSSSSRSLIKLLEDDFTFEDSKFSLAGSRIFDNYILTKIKKVEYCEYDKEVYDLTIKDVHSFAGVNNVIYHNSDNAFWDRPIENFIKPTLNMAAYKMGQTSIPAEIQQRRDLEEYFDKLKWVKFSRLEAQSRQEGDVDSASNYLRQKNSTLFGGDVYGSPVRVMNSLPRMEKAYFNEFVNAQTDEEKAQILSLVPQNEQRLYKAQWARQAEQAAYARRDAGIERKQDQETIESVALSRASQGFNFQKNDLKDWADATQGTIAFDDWMRERTAENYFRDNPLPDSDWMGFNPAIDLEDVQLKYVENLGKEYHDYDLWDSRARALALKPYINDSLIDEMLTPSEWEDSWSVANNARTLTRSNGDKNPEIQYSQINADVGGTRYNIDVQDGRKDLIKKAYKAMGV